MVLYKYIKKWKALAFDYNLSFQLPNHISWYLTQVRTDFSFSYVDMTVTTIKWILVLLNTFKYYIIQYTSKLKNYG